MTVVDVLLSVVSTNFNPFLEIILENNFKIWLNEVIESLWKYNNLLNKLQNLYLSLEKISFIHVYREVNHFAYSLTKLRIHQTSFL